MWDLVGNPEDPFSHDMAQIRDGQKNATYMYLHKAAA